ncbi:MAG: putative Ig domain-containing protein, partial [Synergistaceae bacterium]|nr:putative Ig domain-containing protein [Synergistaceae bacterium]
TKIVTSKVSKPGTITAKPTIFTEALDQGIKGQSYTFRLKAYGTTPITWKVSSLPKGLSLAQDTGIISGKPTATWSKNVKITATNANGSVSKSLKLTIAAAPTASNDVAAVYETVSTEQTEAESTQSSESQSHSGASVGAYVTVPESIGTQTGGYMIAALMGEISCDVAGLYDFGISLDDDTPEGWKLVYIANSDSPSEDDEIVDFYNSDGAPIKAVPADKKISVSIWLNPNRKYEPAIAVMK